MCLFHSQIVLVNFIDISHCIRLEMPLLKINSLSPCARLPARQSNLIFGLQWIISFVIAPEIEHNDKNLCFLSRFLLFFLLFSTFHPFLGPQISVEMLTNVCTCYEHKHYFLLWTQKRTNFSTVFSYEWTELFLFFFSSFICNFMHSLELSIRSMSIEKTINSKAWSKQEENLNTENQIKIKPKKC